MQTGFSHGERTLASPLGGTGRSRPRAAENRRSIGVKAQFAWPLPAPPFGRGHLQAKPSHASNSSATNAVSSADTAERQKDPFGNAFLSAYEQVSTNSGKRLVIYFTYPRCQTDAQARACGKCAADVSLPGQAGATLQTTARQAQAASFPPFRPHCAAPARKGGRAAAVCRARSPLEQFHFEIALPARKRQPPQRGVVSGEATEWRPAVAVAK